MNGITVITPTGDRPLSFGLLRDRWIKHQTIKPNQWIIIDDGLKKYSLYGLPSYSEYVERKSTDSENVHSIGLNLSCGLAIAKYDNILIMEDDDWYAPTYIEFMANLLNDNELAGLWGTNYYHVKIPGYREMGRNTHASLSQTAFKKTFVQNVMKCINGDIQIDLRIWRNNRGLLVEGRNLKLQCSMKGMPGRENAGIGKIEKNYTKDIGYEKLKLWCNDAGVYIDLMERNII